MHMSHIREQLHSHESVQAAADPFSGGVVHNFPSQRDSGRCHVDFNSHGQEHCSKGQGKRRQHELDSGQV